MERTGFLWLIFPLRLPTKYKITASISAFLLRPPNLCLEGACKIISKAGWEVVLYQLRAQIPTGWPWVSYFNLSVPQFPYLQDKDTNGTHSMYLRY